MTRPLGVPARVGMVALVVVTGVAAACGPAGDGGSPGSEEAASGDAASAGADLAAVCSPPPTEGTTLPGDATIADAAGEWTLTVVAEEGEAAGTRQEATLTLMEHSPEMRMIEGFDGEVLRNSIAPLYGATDLDLEALGALRMGGLDSTDPEAPGVGVYETRLPDASRPASIVLRLGSEANRRGSTAIDAGTSVLRVLRIGEGGFAGTWRSQVNARTVASGWFCATPADG